MLRRLAGLFAVLIVATLIPGWVLAQGSEGSSGSERYYKVDEVHAGLPQRDDGIELDTPQATMEAFMLAGKAGDWETAAYALDLSKIVPEAQSTTGPLLASLLYGVIHKAMWIDYLALSDRPDALDANASKDNPMAGEPRRSIRLAILDLPDRPVSIRLSRVKPANDDPVWLFSSQTIGNVVALYRIYGPTDFERSLPLVLQETAIWTLAWWEVFALPVVILAALVVGYLTYVVVGRLQSRQRSKTASKILDAVRVPVALLAVIGTFSLVKTALFTFSGAVDTFLAPLQTILFILAIVLIGVRAVDALLDQIVERNVEDINDQESADTRDFYTNVSAARRLAIVVAFMVGTALVLVQTNAFQTLGFSLLASAGAIGLVIAFAARSVLADIMASLQIAFAKTARIGDAVLYQDQWCYVEQINFTYIQLQTWDDRRLMVPVAQFVASTFENWTKENASLLKPVDMRFDQRTDVDRMRQAFADYVLDDDDIVDKDETKVQVIDQDERGMMLRFVMRAPDASTGWDMQCRLREAMLKAAATFEDEARGGATEGPAFLPREREIRIAELERAG